MATHIAAFESSHVTACGASDVADVAFSQTGAIRVPQLEGGPPRFPKFLIILAASILAVASARAEECDRNPKGLGTSRTIVVDPTHYARIGTMSYPETLPLADKEIVLTFDDGPAHPFTDRVLDILAADCVSATFFIVGRMARLHPELVRRAYAEGHTIGTHTMNHPLRFRALAPPRAQQEIDEGIAAVTAALGDPRKVAPFFRFPGFARTEQAEDYLALRHLMVWGADFPADDWRRIGASGVVGRAVDRLETKGKGILLLHDIHERTVEALPTILNELKRRGYHVVRVVPATPDGLTSDKMAYEPIPREALPTPTKGDAELAPHKSKKQAPPLKSGNDLYADGPSATPANETARSPGPPPVTAEENSWLRRTWSALQSTVLDLLTTVRRHTESLR